MKIYIGRHGLANSAVIDPHVSLSHQGQRETEEIAKLLSKYTLDIRQIYHSDKVRAAQTAEILASNLKIPRQTLPLLNPSSSIEPIISHLEDGAMYIGHLPTVEDLVCELVLKKPIPFVSFIPSTLICLEQVGESWVINWIISPNLINYPLN